MLTWVLEASTMSLMEKPASGSQSSLGSSAGSLVPTGTHWKYWREKKATRKTGEGLLYHPTDDDEENLCQESAAASVNCDLWSIQASSTSDPVAAKGTQCALMSALSRKACQEGVGSGRLGGLSWRDGQWRNWAADLPCSINDMENLAKKVSLMWITWKKKLEKVTLDKRKAGSPLVTARYQSTCLYWSKVQE